MNSHFGRKPGEDMVSKNTSLGILVAVGLFVLGGMARGQDSLWSVEYGGYDNEYGNALLRLSNGDLLLLGSTYSYGSGDHDIYLVRADSTGNTIWARTYGGSGIEYGYDIQAAVDSGYIIVGSTTTWGDGLADLYIIRIDTAGSVIWSETYGGAQNDEARSVRLTSDSGFIVCGTTASYGQNGDIYLIKIDRKGDSTWAQHYGGASGESGSAVRLAPDSGYILIGSTGSYGSGYSSVYLVRTGSLGDTLWTATYGGSRADLGFGLAVTSDKGFILAGATAPTGENYYDAYLVKVDSLGTLEWDSTFGEAYSDVAYSVNTTADGGYIVVGSSEINSGRKIDAYIIKTDAAGAIEWNGAFGGTETELFRAVVADPAGGYLALGHTFSASSGGSDFFLLKAGTGGGTPVDFWSELGPGEEIQLSQNYPNPFNASTQIEFYLPRRGSYQLAVFNILGQTVRCWKETNASCGEHVVVWDGRDHRGAMVASGMYIYQLQAGDYREGRKMILLK